MSGEKVLRLGRPGPLLVVACDNTYVSCMSLEQEIRQSRPFDSLEQAAHLSIVRTAAVLDHALGQALEPFGVTPTQYNVLRILRGAGEAGLCRREVRERMVTPVPDATRLLDRMEAAGWIERERAGEDRRFVTTRITAAGRALADRLDDPIRELHRRHLAGMSGEELQALIDALDRVRAGVEQ